MGYIDYLNIFNRWLETNPLPGNSQLLFFRMLNVFNRAGWPEYVGVDTLRLMSMVDTVDKRTAYRARDKLMESGFLHYEKGKKGVPSKYYIGYMCKNATECGNKNGTKNGTENCTENSTETKPFDETCKNATVNGTENGTESGTKNGTENGTKNDTHIKNETKNDIFSPPISPPRGGGVVAMPQYEPDWFERFYKLYPRKTARANAVKAWDKLKPDRSLCNVMAKALRAQMNSVQWQDKQHIPHPATWLNGARWTDEVEEMKSTNDDFVPPTVQEVADYCRQRNNGIDAESFVAFYQSKGWMVGSNHMVDWHGAVHTWELKRKSELVDEQDIDQEKGNGWHLVPEEWTG